MKKRIKPSLIIILFSLSFMVMYHCATNPVTGKKELMLFSEASEISMGKEIDQELKNEYGIYYDPQLNAYIEEIGQKLAPYTHRAHLKYYFAVLDTPVANAFAAPGGYIYITRGLLAMMNSEAELAAVLGHELGHVSARHSMRSLSRNILITLGLAVASELSEDIKDIAPIAYLATQLLFLKYSRSDEYQADSLGVEYASKSGYQAGEMVNFFNSIQRLTKEEGSFRLPNFLSTHPLTPRRITRVNELLDSAEYKSMIPDPSALMVKGNPYKYKLDGLVYGDNPRQGYTRGNAFYHPEMRFYFNIPNQWQVGNTPKKVTLTPKDGNAVIMLTADSGSKDLETQVNEQIKSLSKFKVISEGYARINGLEAFHKLIQTSTQDSSGNEQENMRVQLTSIRKANTTYNFFAAARAAHYPIYREAVEQTIGSFKALKDSNYLRKIPKRVHIQQLSQQQTLKDYLVSQGIPQKDWQRIALINALELGTSLSPNQLVKIIR